MESVESVEEKVATEKVADSKDVMTDTLEQTKPEKLSIDQMPLDSLRDYRLYNEEAGRINKELRVCKYPYKQCPVNLHPTTRVIFGRVDQPSNPLPVFISNSIIHFDKTLVPGETYDLPQYVVSYLQSKGDPVWAWHDKPDGSRETYVSTYTPRFTLRTVYAA
jgi:hypothetical protein